MVWCYGPWIDYDCFDSCQSWVTYFVGHLKCAIHRNVESREAAVDCTSAVAVETMSFECRRLRETWKGRTL